jgi:hypothetical protein
MMLAWVTGSVFISKTSFMSTDGDKREKGRKGSKESVEETLALRKEENQG